MKKIPWHKDDTFVMTALIVFVLFCVLGGVVWVTSLHNDPYKRGREAAVERMKDRDAQALWRAGYEDRMREYTPTPHAVRLEDHEDQPGITLDCNHTTSLECRQRAFALARTAVFLFEPRCSPTPTPECKK